MSAKKLFIVYGHNNSHFLNLENVGKYIFELFTDVAEIEMKEFLDEFRSPNKTFLHHHFLGPFTDSTEIKKMAFEIGEHFEIESVYLIDKTDYSDCLLRATNRNELIEFISQVADEMQIDPEGSQSSIWTKIFN